MRTENISILTMEGETKDLVKKRNFLGNGTSAFLFCSVNRF